MSDYLTEEEQLQQLKNWLKEYGPSILLAVAIMIAAYFGWQFWQQRQTTLAVNASANYEQLVQDLNAKNNVAIEGQASYLMTQYSKTPYAALAGLILAKYEVEQNKYLPAMQHLQWVIDHGETSFLRQLASTRMAQIQIAENKPQLALQTLAQIKNDSLQALVWHLRASAYLDLKETSQARVAYQKALGALPKSGAMIQPLWQMQLNSLPETAPMVAKHALTQQKGTS